MPIQRCKSGACATLGFLRRTAQFGFLLLVAILLADTASAQPSAAVELSAVYWRPAASLRTASDAAGIPGTPLDLKADTNVVDRGFPAIALGVRLAARHRLRIEYIPIRYEATGPAGRDIVFSGGAYPRGETVTTTFSWSAVNVAYEYDFLMRPRFSLGAIVEAKSTVVEQRLFGATADRSRRTSVPAPAVGFAGRGPIAPRLTLFGEARGFAVPDGENGHYGGRYIDVDGGATVALRRHVGARLGVRWLNIRHLGESDSARLSLAGVYGGVVITSR